MHLITDWGRGVKINLFEKTSLSTSQDCLQYQFDATMPLPVHLRSFTELQAQLEMDRVAFEIEQGTHLDQIQKVQHTLNTQKAQVQQQEQSLTKQHKDFTAHQESLRTKEEQIDHELNCIILRVSNRSK